MYTGLRIKVTIKKDFCQMICGINNEESYFNDYVEQFPFLATYAKLKRSELIPSGISAYMPTDWELREQPTDGFERKFDMETGIWTFQCTLKNYDSVIEHFLTDVLANIIVSAEHIESRHEEDDESIIYKYINGIVVRVN